MLREGGFEGILKLKVKFSITLKVIRKGIDVCIDDIKENKS